MGRHTRVGVRVCSESLGSEGTIVEVDGILPISRMEQRPVLVTLSTRERMGGCE
jgi:hypothetical protein